MRHVRSGSTPVKQYFDGPGTQQVVGGGARQADPLVTVVVTHRVKPEDVDEFLAWQERLRLAESTFQGFRGTELFRPVEGIQEEWTALYRYETAEDLDRWLISEERKELLAEGEKFSDFHSRTIDNSFGNWFAFDRARSRGAAPFQLQDLRSRSGSASIPTVVMLTLALSPLKMPLWLGLLIGNLLSSFALSYLTMPFFVNPLLKHWLRPPPEVSETKTNWRGFALVIGVMAVLSLIFYLVTRVFWHLP